MINANELRIGNIVYDEDKTEMYIAGLWPVNEGKQYNFKDSAGNSGNINLLSPIPSTEEVLLKCGFGKIVGRFIYKEITIVFKNNYINILIDWCLDPIAQFESGSLYLHQLQNLYFALTGQELNTEAFI